MAQNNTADAPGEADEQLKKRARRRLVGAAALVLFAVIVLPMVMDREPRSASPEIQVRIPSQDAPAFDGRLPPTKGDKPLASVEKPVVPADVPKKVEPTPVAPPVVAEKPPEIAARIEKPEPAQAKPVEPKPDAKALAAAATRKADAVEASRAAAALGGSTGEQWVVQLGAYQEPGRVKLLLAKIKELGLPAYTEKVDTPQGPRTRVRAGPFPSRDAATKAQTRVKIIGVDGPVAPK